jgi:hypothetical protein
MKVICLYLFFGVIIFIADLIYFYAITEPDSYIEILPMNKQKTALVDLPLFMSAHLEWQKRIIERLLWIVGGFVVMFICFVFIFLIVR